MPGTADKESIEHEELDRSRSGVTAKASGKLNIEESRSSSRNWARDSGVAFRLFALGSGVNSAAIGHFTSFLYGPKLIQELLVTEAILAVEFAGQVSL